MHKHEGYVCPHCASDENVEVMDQEIDGESLCIKCYCQNCDTIFRDFYILKYDGFVCGGKEFDKDGKEYI